MSWESVHVAVYNGDCSWSDAHDLQSVNGVITMIPSHKQPCLEAFQGTANRSRACMLLCPCTGQEAKGSKACAILRLLPPKEHAIVKGPEVIRPFTMCFLRPARL